MSAYKTESEKLRMTPYEKEMLRKLAEHMGMSKSACIMHLITTAYAQAKL